MNGGICSHPDDTNCTRPVGWKGPKCETGMVIMDDNSSIHYVIQLYVEWVFVRMEVSASTQTPTAPALKDGQETHVLKVI